MESINLNLLAYFAASSTQPPSPGRLIVGITKAVVSQSGCPAEQELKTDLLFGPQRRVEPRSRRLLHARFVMILGDPKSIRRAARTNAAMGLLRIAAPNDYGSCTLAPLVAAFSRKYPACRVDLMLADSKIDLVETSRSLDRSGGSTIRTARPKNWRFSSIAGGRTGRRQERRCGAAGRPATCHS